MPKQQAASIMAQLAEVDDQAVVEIVYTNYRGATDRRRILPSRLWFGCTEWHPQPQWLLDAWDLDKRALRSFALCDIAGWHARIEARHGVE
jgi:predicted DNA-binding transcriptional regulator YafY